MSTQPAINSDARMVAAGLVENGRIGHPFLITATGRAAPSCSPNIPAKLCIPSALLAHADYDDDPNHRPGCGFVGGRLKRLAPMLTTGAILAGANIAVRLRNLPSSYEEILQDLRRNAGLETSLGALFGRVAWSEAMVAIWLDRLRVNGDEAQLILAHAQLALALRKMWLAVLWGVGVDDDADLATASGSVAVGRALIDVISLVDRLAKPVLRGVNPLPEREAALGALLWNLKRYLNALKTAQKRGPDEARKSIASSIKYALAISKAVGVFSVTDDASSKRWKRLTNLLGGGKSNEHAGSAQPKLQTIEKELEQLHCANLRARLERTCWRNQIRRSLLRLATPDSLARLSMLARIRTDLIFTLAMTRQLDRLYTLFPWLAAPHDAFPRFGGGALGAVASFFEAARGLEVGRDMARRVKDAGADRGQVARLTPPAAKSVYASPRHTAVAAGRNHAAGAALISQVTSHVMVKASLENKRFQGLSLEKLRSANLGYNDASALRVETTRNAVIVTQTAQPAFETAAEDNDLVRHMGLTLLQHTGALVREVWPTNTHRADIANHREMIHTGVMPKTKQGEYTVFQNPWRNQSKFSVALAIVRSMLSEIDQHAEQDPEKLVNTINGSLNSSELARADTSRNKATRKTGAHEDGDAGQSLTLDAASNAKRFGERAKVLRELVEDAYHWRLPDRNKTTRAPEDDFLEDLLRGRANLAQLAPVSDLFMPILWFAPFFDRDRLSWIARGMPGQASGGKETQAARLKSWLARLHAWGPALYSNPVTSPLPEVICHLFTGVSSVTADLAHVREYVPKKRKVI